MHESLPPGARRRGSEPIGRGVLAIVFTGALLGLAFNELGRMSRPARGLAWIAEKKDLPSLESLLAQPGGSTPAATPAPQPGASVEKTQEVASKPQSTTQTPGRGEEPRARKPEKKKTEAAATPTPPKSAASPSTTDLEDPLGGVVMAAQGQGVPDIPDLDRPFKVEADTVKKFFDARAALIIDARDAEEYADGHIPGALNLPYDQVVSDPARLQAVDSGGKPIIVYCGGGTCEVSMNLAEALIYQAGKRKVLVYAGGWPEWTQKGYPVEKGKNG